MKKILIITNSKNNMSGSQVMIKKIVEKLSKTNKIYLLVDQSTNLFEELRHKKIVFLNMKINKISKYYFIDVLYIFKTLFNNIKIKKYVERNQIDIIWSENIHTLLNCILINRRKTRVFQNMWSIVRSKYLHNIMQKYSSEMIVESKAHLHNIKTHNKPIHVIYTQLDKRIFENVKLSIRKADFIVIGFLGGTDENKGYDILIEIASKLQDNINVRFHIAGEINETKMILLDNITYFGWIKDKSKFYSEVDIVVSLSKSEGLSGVIREAMGFAKPVISTNVGAANELVKDSFLLVDYKTKDYIVHNVIEKIEILYHDLELYYKISASNYMIANEQFIGDMWLNQLEEVLTA